MQFGVFTPSPLSLLGGEGWGEGGAFGIYVRFSQFRALPPHPNPPPRWRGRGSKKRRIPVLFFRVAEGKRTPCEVFLFFDTFFRALRWFADFARIAVSLQLFAEPFRPFGMMTHANHPCSIQPSLLPEARNAHARWPSPVCTT